MEVRHAALCGMNAGAAERAGADVLVSYAFNDFRAGDKHLADVVNDENEVGNTGGVYGSAGAVSGNNGNLRDISGG